jgi:hypothetical protein
MNFLDSINNNKMKNIFLSLIALIFLIGCAKPDTHTYTIENTTNKTIIVEAFAVAHAKEMNINPIYFEKFIIDPFSKYTVIKEVGGEDGEEEGLFKNTAIDSVNIVFDSKKIIKYKCVNQACNDKRNLINYLTYYERKCDKQDCIFTFILTEEDYLSADTIH